MIQTTTIKPQVFEMLQCTSCTLVRMYDGLWFAPAENLDNFRNATIKLPRQLRKKRQFPDCIVIINRKFSKCYHVRQAHVSVFTMVCGLRLLETSLIFEMLPSSCPDNFEQYDTFKHALTKSIENFRNATTYARRTYWYLRWFVVCVC